MNSHGPFEELKQLAHGAAKSFLEIESGDPWFPKYIGQYAKGSCEYEAMMELTQLYISHILEPIATGEGAAQIDTIRRKYLVDKYVRESPGSDCDWLFRMFQFQSFLILAHKAALQRVGLTKGEIAFVCPICGGQASGYKDHTRIGAGIRMVCENGCVNSMS